MSSIIKNIHSPALLILLTFFSQFYIAQELWIANDRELPLIPFFEFLPLQFGKAFDQLMIVSMFLSLVFVVLKPDQKKWLLLFFIPALLLILEDAMRLQPWFFLHVVMIGLIAFEKEITREKVKQLLQWIVIAVYFWGGINKLNIAFAWEIFPWFTEHLGIGEDYFLGMHNLNTFELPSKNYIAFLIPLAEIFIAVCLFIPRLRLFGLIGSLVTHLVSLYAIGPYGHNWNQIVWPWNIQMPILCWLLFRPKEKTVFPVFLKEQKEMIATKTGKLILFLFFVCPVLSFFHWWDKGLSMHLYSGNTDEMEFYFEGFEEKLIETSLAEHLYFDTLQMASAMKVEYWVIDQTGVPMYATTRHMKKIGKYLCGCLDHPEKGGVRLLLRSGFYSKQDTITIPCRELE